MLDPDAPSGRKLRARLAGHPLWQLETHRPLGEVTVFYPAVTDGGHGPDRDGAARVTQARIP